MKPLVLLDLDGTLSDSAPGITASVLSAFAEMGLPAPTSPREFVGPPLPVAMADHGVPAERIGEAIIAYRRAYEGGGMWQSAPFDGVAEQLRLLRQAGCELVIATSKPHKYAVPICERWGLHALVDHIVGAPPDEVPSSKATVIADALAQLGPSVPERPNIVMVGDRHHDIDGAAEHGIVCLGVAWGYAQPGELDDAAGVIERIDDLAADVLALVQR